jgi:hypothetical protein
MQDYNVRFPAYDGDGRLYAEITKQELSGKWRVMDVDRSVLESFVRLCCIRTPVPEVWEADVMDLENAETVRTKRWLGKSLVDCWRVEQR